MAKLTFLGGIHPYDGKDLSKDKPIVTVLPKGELVYPLSQHIGAPATAIVAKGDRVLVGQKIAEATGFVSAPIYASVSGTVKAIEPRRVVTGDSVMSIIVENDGQYEEKENMLSVKPLEDMSKEDIITAVKEAGIVGMGGATFSTSIKSAVDAEIDTLIANACECEPYITSDSVTMVDHTDDIELAIKTLVKYFNIQKTILLYYINS